MRGMAMTVAGPIHAFTGSLDFDTRNSVRRIANPWTAKGRAQVDLPHSQYCTSIPPIKWPMSTNHELKVIHDRLLAEKPEDAEHDADQCVLCALEDPDNQATTPGGSMPESFTQEDVDAAVADATAGLQKRLSDLEGQVQETEVGKAVAAAIAPKDASINELQSKLDAAEAARTAAESKLAETEQYWTAAIAEHEQAVAFAARRDARVAAAKEASVFSDEYVAEHADRFAAMEDADFSARLEEWRLIAADRENKVDAAASSKVPATTALQASRVDENKSGSALTYISEMRTKGHDPRVLGGVS